MFSHCDDAQSCAQPDGVVSLFCIHLATVSYCSMYKFHTNARLPCRRLIMYILKINSAHFMRILYKSYQVARYLLAAVAWIAHCVHADHISSGWNMFSRPGCWWKSSSGRSGREEGRSAGFIGGVGYTGPRSSWNNFKLSVSSTRTNQFIYIFRLLKTGCLDVCYENRRYALLDHIASTISSLPGHLLKQVRG